MDRYRLEPVKDLRTKDGKLIPPGPWIQGPITPDDIRKMHERIARTPVEKSKVPPLFKGLIPRLRGMMHR